MTNVESQMSKEARKSKHETFVIRALSFVRHLAFDIRHSRPAFILTEASSGTDSVYQESRPSWGHIRGQCRFLPESPSCPPYLHRRDGRLAGCRGTARALAWQPGGLLASSARPIVRSNHPPAPQAADRRRGRTCDRAAAQLRQRA